MVVFIFIILPFFFFNCNGYSILSVDYNYDSNIWHNFTYSGDNYDYFALMGQVYNFTLIEFDLITITHAINVSYIFSNKNYSEDKD